MGLNNLLWIVVVVLLLAWALGFGGVYHLGGNPSLIHILLLVIVIVVVFNVISSRPPSA